MIAMLQSVIANTNGAKPMTFETELRDRFNRPELLAIWAEMKAALDVKNIPAYKAAGARYRAAKAALVA